MLKEVRAEQKKKQTVEKEVLTAQQKQWHSAIVQYVQCLVQRGLEQQRRLSAIVELWQRLVRRGLETQRSLDQM